MPATATKATRRQRRQQRRPGQQRARTPAKPKANRQVRADQRFLERNPLYNPSAQLSGRELKRSVRQLVNLEFAPKEGALDREARTAERQGGALSKNAGDYYLQLADREAGTVAQQQALAKMTNTQLGKIAGDTQGQIDQSQVQEQERLGVDAATRGAGLSGGSDALSELAAQRARAAEGSQGFRAAGALQGGNYGQLALANRSARGMRGGELQRELANRLANKLGDVRDKRSELQSLRGPALTKALLGLRQSGFENLATSASLDLKQSELASEAQESAAERRLRLRQQREVERKNRTGESIDLLEEQGRNRRDDDEGASGPSNLTPTQKRGYQQKYDQATALVRNDKHFDRLRRNPGKYADKTIENLVAAGYPRAIARAAVQTALNQASSMRFRRRVRRRYGVRVGRGNPVTRKVGQELIDLDLFG